MGDKTFVINIVNLIVLVINVYIFSALMLSVRFDYDIIIRNNIMNSINLILIFIFLSSSIVYPVIYLINQKQIKEVKLDE